MSNLFKSKFLTGALIVAAVFVVVGFSKPTPAAADCSITSTLRIGSTGTQVVCLQTALGGLTPDGSFGPLTKAAVVSWQAKSGLVADGIFGPKSNQVWMANQSNVGVFPAGCTSAVGYSSTTGGPCYAVSANTFAPTGCTSASGYSPVTGGACYAVSAGPGPTGFTPAGCTSANGYSPVTGGACQSLNLPAGCTSTAGFSPTTGASCSGAGTVVTTPSGTNGYLTDLALDSTGRVSTIYESEQGKVVAGFRATARLADQTVDRVRVTFANAGTGSANLSRYISGASLWNGSTKVATIPVASADRNTSTDVYTFNFTGLNSKVLKDQIGRFYVSVDANGSIDTGDSGALWTVTFLARGVSASSPDGTYDTYPTGDLAQTGLSFGKFSSSGVKATVSAATTNPAVSTTKVETNSVITTGVKLLDFKVASTGSALTIRKIPIQITSTGLAAGPGTIAVSGTAVTGTSTTFLSTFVVGDVITDSGSNARAITAIASDTALTAATGLVTGTGAYTQTATVASMINTVKLYRDGQLVDSLDGGAGTAVSSSITTGACTTTCGFIFSNLSAPYNQIAADSSATYSVVVDLKGLTGGKYLSGNKLTASFASADVVLSANFSVQDVNGDQLATSARLNSATGNAQTFLTDGALVTVVSSSYTAYNPTGPVDGTVSLTFTVKAFGSSDVTMSENQGSTETVAAGNNVVSYTVDSAAATGSLITSTTQTATGGIFTVSAGDTQTYTLAVKFGVSSGFVRLTINSVDGTTVTNIKSAAY